MTDGSIGSGDPRPPESEPRDAAEPVLLPNEGGVGFAALSGAGTRPAASADARSSDASEPTTDPAVRAGAWSGPEGAPVSWPTPTAGATETPRQSGIGRNLIIFGVLAVIVVGAFLFRDRLSGSAGDLRVGDCFDEPQNLSQVTDVQHRPCTEAHDGEVMFVGDYPPADTYPGRPAFEDFVLTTCATAYQAYLGRDYASDTTYDLGVFYPTEESWGSGDHEIACYVYRIDEEKLTTSVKKAA
jgi:hypothetical protein